MWNSAGGWDYLTIKQKEDECRLAVLKLAWSRINEWVQMKKWYSFIKTIFVDVKKKVRAAEKIFHVYLFWWSVNSKTEWVMKDSSSCLEEYLCIPTFPQSGSELPQNQWYWMVQNSCEWLPLFLTWRRWAIKAQCTALALSLTCSIPEVYPQHKQVTGSTDCFFSWLACL